MQLITTKQIVCEYRARCIQLYIYTAQDLWRFELAAKYVWCAEGYRARKTSR